MRGESSDSPARAAAALLPPALLFLVVLVLAGTGGVGQRELAVAALAVLATQVVPGLVLWRFLRPRHGYWVEDMAVGAALGAGMAVFWQVLAAATSIRWLTAGLPILLAVLLLVVPASRRRVRSARTRGLPWLWGTGVAAASLLTARVAIDGFAEPVRWRGWGVPYVDMPYHLALVGEVSSHFPPHYPQVAEETLYYHWFAHAWTAQVGAVSAVPLDVLLMRFTPALLAVLVPVLTAVVAVRLSGLAWAGPAAAAVTFLVTDFDVWDIGSASTPITTAHSPTQGFGLVMLLLALLVLTLRWRFDIGKASVLLLVPVLVLVGGSKGSALPVLLGGVGLAAVAAVVMRTRSRGRVVSDAALTFGVLVVVFSVIFDGAAGGSRIVPLEPLVDVRGKEMLGTSDVSGLTLWLFAPLALMPFFFGGLAAFAVFLSEKRRELAPWLLLGSALVGVLAASLIKHQGLSQLYFVRTAQVPLGILAGWGVVLLLRRSRTPLLLGSAGLAAGLLAAWFGDSAAAESGLARAWIAVGLFLLVTGAVGALVATLARPVGRRVVVGASVVLVAITSAGLLPTFSALLADRPEADPATRQTTGAIHSGEIRAARWIRDHAEPADLVATNRHCRGEDRTRCDHRRFVVAAYSERRVLVEGWTYTKQANQLARELGMSQAYVPFWDRETLRTNDRFIQRPNREDAGALHDLGVRWLYVDKDAPHRRNLAPFAVKRFETRFAAVYELRDPLH